MVCLIAQTEPPLEKKTKINSLAIWSYDGLSPNQLETVVTEHEVGANTDQSIDYIDYRFEGDMLTYFLTRC
jgi:hypothetical protein